MNLPPAVGTNTMDRLFEFLNESNWIEGIREINYADQANQNLDSGHFGALIDALDLGGTRTPLTHRHICRWQSLVTREQLSAGHQLEEREIGHIRGPNLPKNVRIGTHFPPDWSSVPTLLSQLIEEINEGLKDQGKLKDDAEYCKFLGRSFQKFESIHPFADGNGRVGRLLAVYIATFCKRPVIVFKSEMCEKNEYYRAHETAGKMISFMAKKMQEAIFGEGENYYSERINCRDNLQNMRMLMQHTRKPMNGMSSSLSSRIQTRLVSGRRIPPSTIPILIREKNH